MNWNLLVTIFSSSLVAAFLTKCLDLYSGSLTYKRDYYKKVIKERLKVYTYLNEVLYQAVGHITDKNNSYNVIFTDAKTMHKFINDLIIVANSRIWLSIEMGHKIVEMVQFLSNRVIESNLSPNTPSLEIERFGITINKEFERLREEIEVLVINDFSELYDVKTFFATQKN